MNEETTKTGTHRCETCQKALRGSIYDHLCTACQRADDLARLRKWLPPGSTVWTNLHHVSRSGMSRLISVHVADADGINNVSGYVARVLGMNLDRDRLALKVSGCGMDMGFHVAYNLARTLYADGFQCPGKLKRRSMCPSNDHSNGDRNYRKHKHSDGGYALNHRWI